MTDTLKGETRSSGLWMIRPRKAALDQAGDHRALAEGAFHQRRFGEPGLEIVPEHVLGEQFVHEAGIARGPCCDVARAIDRDAVIVRHEAQGLELRPLEAACDEHAERLVREPALEGKA